MKFNPSWPTKKEKNYFIHTSVNVGNVKNNGSENNAKNNWFSNTNFQHKILAFGINTKLGIKLETCLV